MRPFLVFFIGAAGLSACSVLPIPIELDPGAYREGSQTFSLTEYGGQVKDFTARLRPFPLTFEPPQVPLTYAEVDAALEVRAETDPPAVGAASFALYLAPRPPGAPCAYEDTYRNAYRLASAGFAIGASSYLSVLGVLEQGRNDEQLAALNRGALCLGLSVSLNASEYFDGVRLTWKFTRLRAGVGIF